MAESHVQTLQTKEAPSRAEISPDADWLAGVALRCGAGIGAGAVLFGVLRWNDVAPDHAFVSALVLALSICFRWETALAGSVVFGTLLKASSEPLQRFTEILSNGTKIARFYNAVDQAGYLEFIALVFLLVFPVYGIIYCARTILGSFRLVERHVYLASPTSGDTIPIVAPGTERFAPAAKVVPPPRRETGEERMNEAAGG